MITCKNYTLMFGIFSSIPSCMRELNKNEDIDIEEIKKFTPLPENIVKLLHSCPYKECKMDNCKYFVERTPKQRIYDLNDELEDIKSELKSIKNHINKHWWQSL
jgi:hypothetical protein